MDENMGKLAVYILVSKHPYPTLPSIEKNYLYEIIPTLIDLDIKAEII